MCQNLEKMQNYFSKNEQSLHCVRLKTIYCHSNSVVRMYALVFACVRACVRVCVCVCDDDDDDDAVCLEV